MMNTLIRLTIAHASYRVKFMYTAFFDQTMTTRNSKHEKVNDYVRSDNSNNNVSSNGDDRKHNNSKYFNNNTVHNGGSNQTKTNIDNVLDELIPPTHCTPAPTTLIDALVAIGLCDSTLHFLTGKTFLGQCIFALLQREMQNACASEMCKVQSSLDATTAAAATTTNAARDGSNIYTGNTLLQDEAANEL